MAALTGNLRTIVATVAMVLVLCVPGGAQSSRWADPYDKGLKAFQAGRFAEAITLLERAVAADPKADPKKREEGVYTVEYIPYLYLGAAHAELGQWDKAQQNLDKARATLPRQQQARFNAAESKIKSARATPAPPPPPGPTPSGPPPRNADFEARERELGTFLSDKRFDDAIKKLEQLRSIDAGEYAKSGMAAKREEAVKGLANQLTDAAKASIQASKFKDAQAKLQQADQLLPNQKPVSNLLAELKKRDDDYQRFRAGAQVDFTAKNYASARGKFQQAQAANPEQFGADNLAPRLAEAGKLAVTVTVTPVLPAPGPNPPPPPPLDPRIAEGQKAVDLAKQFVAQGRYGAADAAWADAVKKNPLNKEATDAVATGNTFRRLRDQALQQSKSKDAAGAQQTLVAARNLDPSRFEGEGLNATLAKLTKATGDSPATVTLQEGLLALVKGDTQKSIDILQPAVRDGDKSAALHAYLGVAYAARALAAPKPEEQTKLRESAIEQFKLAKAANPKYQLSPRIVSPAILSIYQSTNR